MAVVVRMVVGSLVILMATLTTKAAASVRSEARQADLIRHQLLKDLGMEAAPDTAKVGKRRDYLDT